MELGEGVLSALEHHPEHSEETCAFCNASEVPTTETNVLTDSVDEDADELPGLEDDGIAFKNSAGQLGSALIKAGEPQLSGIVKLDGSSNALTVHTAAHHLIPGNAALKRSDLMPYLHKDGTAAGNIGYNVNNPENGSWLVGNYALRGKSGMPRWGPEGTAFLRDTNKDPKEYAFAAIRTLRRQFHDGHGDYNDFVLNELDLLAKKLEKTRNLWCPEGKRKEKDGEGRTQMFMLVARLNTVPRRLKAFVENPGPKWRENLVTSRFSLAFIRERILKGLD